MDFQSCDYCTRDKFWLDSIFLRETIQPEYTVIYNFDYQADWELFEGHCYHLRISAELMLTKYVKIKLV